MTRIVVGWTWKQALAFLVLYGIVCGPWIYWAWRIA